MTNDYTRKQAINDLNSLKEYFMSNTNGATPICIDYAIDILKEYETEYDDGKLLKKRYGEYVTYKVDYLLDHLAREIYLMQTVRNWKETGHCDTGRS